MPSCRDRLTECQFSFLNFSKNVCPSLLAIALLVATFFWVLLPDIHDIIFNQKKASTAILVQTAKRTLDFYEQEVKSGKITLPEAQKAAISHFRTIRYDNENYFWINDLEPRMLMHPYRADLEGQNISTFEDSNGTFPFLEMVNIAKKQGAGFIPYLWQWRDNPGRIMAKHSYIELFQPWGWIIGSGIYAADVEKEIKTVSHRLSQAALIIIMTIMLIAIFIVRQQLNECRKREAAEKEVQRYQNELEKLVEERTIQLEKALKEVKTLSGFLPICASCKKIRDDQGYWNKLEHYISKHSEAVFSHGICPDCAQKLYPEFIAKTDQRRE
ncbi:MAG: cache domain-containing protein [Deltaproteobacteria bacterium]|nr:cache domain-containing protein [Deltaproteobacteria bacterium]